MLTKIAVCGIVASATWLGGAPSAPKPLAGMAGTGRVLRTQ